VIGAARPRPILLCAIVAAASACGGNEPSSETGEAEDTVGTAVTTAARDDTVRVFLSEYRIDMPTSLDAGEIVFTVMNEGFEDHNIRISDPATDSVLWQTDGNVSPGDRVVGRLDLGPGAYMVICDFAGHDSRGMFLELAVREPN
jgi:hypothetical protein